MVEALSCDIIVELTVTVKFFGPDATVLFLVRTVEEVE